MYTFHLGHKQKNMVNFPSPKTKKSLYTHVHVPCLWVHAQWGWTDIAHELLGILYYPYPHRHNSEEDPERHKDQTGDDKHHKDVLG